MSRLSLNLLGPFEACLNGEAVHDLRSRPVQALLIYLAVERSRAQRREGLFTLLWPGMPEKSARHNLSQALYALRQAYERVMLVACDPYRPAAVQQLETLGRQLDVPVFFEQNVPPPKLASKAVDSAKKGGSRT